MTFTNKEKWSAHVQAVATMLKTVCWQDVLLRKHCPVLCGMFRITRHMADLWLSRDKKIKRWDFRNKP